MIFWDRVDRSGDCWLWLGPLTADGYGKAVQGRKPVRAHRLAYELVKGPIPVGLTIDHLCRTRRCVNPDHMEPVTNRVNVLRGIGPTAVRARQRVCIRGHALTGIDHRGYRFCKECKRLRDRAAYQPRPRTGMSVRDAALIAANTRGTCQECGRSMRASQLGRHEAAAHALREGGPSRE